MLTYACVSGVKKLIIPQELKYWVGVQRTSLTLLGEGASLALIGPPSSDGVLIKIPHGVDVLLYRPAPHPIVSYWAG